MNVKDNRILLVLVIILSIAVMAVFACATYNINYWPTDSWHLYIPAAKYTEGFPVVSNIHKQNRFHSLHFKELLVLSLSAMQHILGDFDSLYPNVLLLIIANCLSGILIYLILQKWLDPPTGLIGFFLFITCFWPYQYTLLGSHQPLVLMNFLISVFFLTRSTHLNLSSFFSGAFLGMMIFSSPTSPIYLPYYFFAFAFFLKKAKCPIKDAGRTLLWTFIGLALVTFIVTYPDPLKNTLNYVHFLKSSQAQNNFTNPQFYFGEAFPQLSERGAGWVWIIKYFFHILPVLFTFYILCFLFLIGTATGAPLVLILLIVSLSTPIGAETIQVAQFGRNYFSWLLAMIIVVAYAVFLFKTRYFVSLSKTGQNLAKGLLTLLLVVHLTSNAQTFFYDVFPSRMASNAIYDFFKKHPGRPIYVYRSHPFNVNTIDHINNPKYAHPLTFTYVNSIAEAESGFFFIPPLTGKTIWANCQISDYQFDPYLNGLLMSGKFPDYMAKSFKTVASSNIWIHEEEYCTYLDLIAGKITPVDRIKGMAFILDVDRLKEGDSP